MLALKCTLNVIFFSNGLIDIKSFLLSISFSAFLMEHLLLQVETMLNFLDLDILDLLSEDDHEMQLKAQKCHRVVEVFLKKIPIHFILVYFILQKSK